MKRALVFEHAETEGPERVADLLAARGITCEVARLYRGDPVPDALAPDQMLVVMGGPMGVGDVADPRYPFLGPEIALLRRLVAAERPVLGICLGAQLLAAGAGARVYPNRVREVGWGPVDFLDAKHEPVFRGLGARAPMLHWHGDTFDLPVGAVHLASTPECHHQAFRLGWRQFGLQFHPELKKDTIATWVRADADFVRAAKGDGGAAQILADTDRYFAEASPVWDVLLGNVLDSMLRD